MPLSLSFEGPSMAVQTLTLSLMAIFSLLSLSSAVPSATVLDAAEILSDAGYVAMALTLSSLASQTQTQTLTLTPHSTLTVFAPSDAAFAGAGQPTLSLLRYHFSPLSLPLRTLRSLPAGAEIPTLSGGRNLVVTSAAGEISVNGVSAAASPIFDDGLLVVYGIDQFLNPSFRGCGSSAAGAPPWIREASGSLRRSGYSATASNLDVQLVGFGAAAMAVTVFAPPDKAVAARLARNESAALVFLRHAVPCKLSMSELANFSNGAVLPTFSEGFRITIGRSGNSLRLNGVSVSQADIYIGDSIAVHGLSEILPARDSESE